MLEAAAEVAAALAAEWWVAKEAAEEGGKRAVPVAVATEMMLTEGSSRMEGWHIQDLVN